MDRTRTILVTAILCLGFGLFIPSVASLAAGRWHGPTAIETCADWCGQQFCSKCPHPVQNLCRGNQIPTGPCEPVPKWCNVLHPTYWAEYECSLGFGLRRNKSPMPGPQCCKQYGKWQCPCLKS